MPARRTAAALVAAVLLLAFPRTSDAQRACKTGTPCGRSCISAGKVCRIGAPPSTPSPAPSTPAPSAEPKPVTPQRADTTASDSATATDSATGPGTTKVWVNRKSRVYHCPGTRWFGATADGLYMREKEALAAGHRGMRGKACGS